MALTAKSTRAVLFEAVQRSDQKIAELEAKIQLLETFDIEERSKVTVDQYRQDIVRRFGVVVREVRDLIDWVKKDIETTKRWAEVSLPKFNLINWGLRPPFFYLTTT